MIQRKQTIFILTALALTVCCLCLPVCALSQGIGIESTMYNLWVTDANGTHDCSVWALFAILLATCPISVIAIFSYRNRIVQSRFCMFNILLLLGWHIVLAVFMMGLTQGGSSASIHVSAAFPLISIILYFLARKAILADEALVRAADRIR